MSTFSPFSEHQPRGLRPACSAEMSRLEFLARRVLSIGVTFLVTDAASVLLRIIGSPYHGRPIIFQSLIAPAYGLLSEFNVLSSVLHFLPYLTLTSCGSLCDSAQYCSHNPGQHRILGATRLCPLIWVSRSQWTV